MRFPYIFSVLRCGKTLMNYTNCTRSKHIRTMNEYRVYKKKFSVTSSVRNDDVDDFFESNYELYEKFLASNQNYCRDLLYKQPQEWLLKKITYSASLQELFQLIQSNRSRFKSEHLVQSVLVLCDLKSIYEHVNRAGNDVFYKQLEGNTNFQQLLALIENHIDNVDRDSLSYLVMYLNLLGIKTDTRLMQLLTEKLEKLLVENFSIGAASRFLQTIFSEKTLKSYFLSQRILPSVLQQIDICSIETLHDLTTSLNNLNDLIPQQYLEKYVKKVNEFIEDKQLTHEHYKTILQIILLLNYPKWRFDFSVCMVKAILLLENNLIKLNIAELIVVYEIFFKLQEPGKILSELQRCCSRYLRQLEDVISREKLILFSSLLYFSSTNLRKEMNNDLEKYVKACDNLDDLFILRKIITTVKTGDSDLCGFYWKKVLTCMKKCDDSTALKIAQNYLKFNMEIDSYRSIDFEKEMMEKLEKIARDDFAVFPKRLAHILCVALIYSDNYEFLDYLTTKIEDNYCQLNSLDCLKLATSLRALNNTQNKFLKVKLSKRLSVVANKLIDFQIGAQFESTKNYNLMKSHVVVPSDGKDMKMLDEMFVTFKRQQQINSQTIENISYCFLMTSTLIPDILDDFVDYLLKHPDFYLGFNVAKVLHTFFILGYSPKEDKRQFFDTATNIIIRDQERMSGLSIIQCALALCYFNSLPNSLIKSVFNTEFMDKLDDELHNCYSKDKYPHRVRSNLMQLNRAVCIDCPESQVPWFHQKYLTEIVFIGNRHLNSFHNKVKDSLLPLVRDKELIIEHFTTPYGYRVDFLLGLSNNNRFISPNISSKRLAILLIPQQAFTRSRVQLKGKYTLKKRHLEMLGYKVITISFSDWMGLFYPQERLCFLSNLIWPIEPIEKLIR